MMHAGCAFCATPRLLPGRITVPVCGEAGEKLLTVTKKDPLWKRVRKIKWGERL